MDLLFSLLITTFIFLLIVFRLFTILKHSGTRSKTAKFLPGPGKLPIFGSLHHLAGSLPHRILRDLSRKYGPIMHLQLGETSAIVISSPKIAKEVLKTHDLAFVNRPELLAAKIILYGSQDISFAPYGAYWRQMRKICTSELLSVTHVRSFSSIREDETLKFIESIRTSAESAIKITEKIFSLTNDITFRAAFGNKSEHRDALIPLFIEIASVAGGFDVSDVFPSLKLLHVIVGTKRRIVSLHHKIDKFLESIVSEHEENRANLERGMGELRGEDLLDVLLRHQKNNDLECPITTNNIKAILLDMIMGGTDTSSSTLEWALSELMRNPRVMEKIQAELRQALKGKKSFQETDCEGLDYLKLVIKETLRLHPSLPLLLPRECREQHEIDGYLIPIKTKVIVNAWALGRDPEHWDDAECFIPERFCDKSVNFMGADFEYIPFGAGRRICPGMSFGLANVEFPLAQLLYHFNWELPNGMKPEDLDMTEAFGVTARRRKHLELVATPYIP